MSICKKNKAPLIRAVPYVFSFNYLAFLATTATAAIAAGIAARAIAELPVEGLSAASVEATTVVVAAASAPGSAASTVVSASAETARAIDESAIVATATEARNFFIIIFLRFVYCLIVYAL